MVQQLSILIRSLLLLCLDLQMSNIVCSQFCLFSFFNSFYMASVVSLAHSSLCTKSLIHRTTQRFSIPKTPLIIPFKRGDKHFRWSIGATGRLKGRSVTPAVATIEMKLGYVGNLFLLRFRKRSAHGVNSNDYDGVFDILLNWKGILPAMHLP